MLQREALAFTYNSRNKLPCSIQMSMCTIINFLYYYSFVNRSSLSFGENNGVLDSGCSARGHEWDLSIQLSTDNDWWPEWIENRGSRLEGFLVKVLRDRNGQLQRFSIFFFFKSVMLSLYIVGCANFAIG